MDNKTKISAAQAAQVYAEVPGVLRKLASEKDQLQTKLAEAEKELQGYKLADRISKIAQTMEDKKINLGLSLGERISKIKEAHASGRSLDAIEEAIDMTAPNGEMAKVAGDVEGNGENALEAFLLGGLAQ
jgi:hypothetical protein